MSFELVGEVRDGDVVFREFLFRVDKVLEMFGNELFELVKRNEGRLDVVGLVVLSGHSEAEECPSGVDGVRLPRGETNANRWSVKESFLG